MGRFKGVLAGALTLSLGLIVTGTSACATDCSGEIEGGPVIVDDRLVAVPLTPALRRRLAASRGVIVEPRFSSFRYPRRPSRPFYD